MAILLTALTIWQTHALLSIVMHRYGGIRGAQSRNEIRRPPGNLRQEMAVGGALFILQRMGASDAVKQHLLVSQNLPDEMSQENQQ